MNHNLFELPPYKNIHQVRRAGKGGGIAVFLHESLTFNIRQVLTMPTLKLCAWKLLIKSKKNILINTQYRQPAGNFSEFEAYSNTFLAKSKTTD